MHSLDDLMKHSLELYGRRDRIFFPSLQSRIDLFNLAVGDLEDAIRKDADDAVLRGALARLVSRIFCISEHFSGNLPLIEMFARKYFQGRCAYCLKIPCACPEKRPEPHLHEGVKTPVDLREACSLLRELYGTRNTAKGLDYMVGRLFKEVSELMGLLMVQWEPGTTIANIEETFALELADALAWTIAIANFFVIDLEAAFLERYGNGCSKCHHTPCECIGFSWRPFRG
jgi:NTP pyrophosphatase (non-canonical NTP hydrolase)